MEEVEVQRYLVHHIRPLHLRSNINWSVLGGGVRGGVSTGYVSGCVRVSVCEWLCESECVEEVEVQRYLVHNVRPLYLRSRGC